MPASRHAWQASLDLGIIGNGTINALVDARGRIVWHCVPAFDGDPVFCSLLSPKPGDMGFFDIALENEAGRRQRYVDNSAVLVTVLTAKDGAEVEITDLAPRYKLHERTYHPMQILRRMRPLSGSPRIALRLRPLTGYGARRPERTFGSNHLRFMLDPLVLRATTDAQMPMLKDELPFLLDRDIHVVLGTDETLQESPRRYFDEALNATLRYWHEWSRYLSIPAEWQDAVIRAAITLKLCQYEGTGAIVAAMTTSIPEAPDTVRTWDYRYCWPRDAALSVRALNRLSATRTMEEYVRYIFNLAVGDDSMAPVYGIHFQDELPEREEATLAGYRGMGPVRVGNEAWKQQQNDIYGSVVLAATQMFFDRRLVKVGGETEFRRLERCGEAAWKLHDKPDAGLWELRGRKSVHTYSAVMCWVACDRLSNIAVWLKLDERAAFWRKRADRIRKLVLKHAVHADGHFVESFGSDQLDASLLLLEGLRFVRADDPRFVKTVDAIGKKLMRNGFLRRYAQPDDFGAPRSSFIVCNFWYVEALIAIGRKDEARKLFEKLLAIRNPIGLLSEDYDARRGELWGNFPQTYSMVGLINAARGLSTRWSDVV
ncbi:MAG TPA: glycoside hydrolase family 15 protein [Rhodanobacteraceae bacterium]|nr:glycoside hydrolase family 15 protein [Rhodanobacteraceae bacterium]